MFHNFSPTSNKWGCIATHVETAAEMLPYAVCFIAATSNQILTLVLFLIPLHCSLTFKRKLKRQLSNPHSINPGRKNVLGILKRSFIAGVFCFITDIASLLYKVVAPKHYPMSLSMLMFDLALTTNVMCLIFTFKDWKSMLSITRMKAAVTKVMPNSVIRANTIEQPMLSTVIKENI